MAAVTRRVAASSEASRAAARQARARLPPRACARGCGPCAATAPPASALLTAGARRARPRAAGDATGATAPYEDLIEVLATLTWHLRDDVYRFPPPKDPTGHDLYKLSLTRLESWEKRFPGRMRDVTTFGRAQALERLGEYQRAADAYGAGRGDAGLAARRRRRRDGAERAAAFAAAAALPEDGDGVEEQLGALRRKLDAWGALVERLQGHAVRVRMALVEEERLERATTRLVVDHRRDLERGDETAEKALRFLIQKHADSKNLPGHVLRLGDLYADLAREYVAQHERPLAFDEDEFVASRRPRARHLPQGRGLGRRTREARGAGALRGHGSVEERHAGALPVMRVALLAALAARRSRPRAGRADDLLGEAARADARARGARPLRPLAARARRRPARRRRATWRRSIASATPRGQRPTGLTDDIRLLAAGARADARRPPRRAARTLLDERPRSRRRARSPATRSSEDDAAAAEQAARRRPPQPSRQPGQRGHPAPRRLLGRRVPRRPESVPARRQRRRQRRHHRRQPVELQSASRRASARRWSATAR